MNAPPDPPKRATEMNVPGEESSPEKLVNPLLSGSLASDYEALQNDLVQARELASDFQRELADKTNDYAQLKQVLEKTQEDLARLQNGIVELRAERHRLANEAMRAVAYQTKLATVTNERDRLRIDLEILRTAMTKNVDDSAAGLLERDRKIAELVVEIVNLRQALEESRQRWIG
jgi:chromosome segregation ATPase